MQWFDEWLGEYLSVLGIEGESEVRQAAAWEAVFAAAGFTEAEVRRAGAEVLANLPQLADSPDRFLGKVPMHLAALQRRVRQRRAVQFTHSPDTSADDRLGACVLCKGTGRVVVPHPASVAGGAWVGTTGTTRSNAVQFYALAVVCRCFRGAALRDRLDRQRSKFVLLEEYDRQNPHWAAQLERRRREESAERRARPPGNSPEEQRWQQLVLSLSGQFGVRSESGEDG